MCFRKIIKITYECVLKKLLPVERSSFKGINMKISSSTSHIAGLIHMSNAKSFFRFSFRYKERIGFQRETTFKK